MLFIMRAELRSGVSGFDLDEWEVMNVDGFPIQIGFLRGLK